MRRPQAGTEQAPEKGDSPDADHSAASQRTNEDRTLRRKARTRQMKSKESGSAKQTSQPSKETDESSAASKQKARRVGGSRGRGARCQEEETGEETSVGASSKTGNRATREAPDTAANGTARFTVFTLK